MSTAMTWGTGLACEPRMGDDERCDSLQGRRLEPSADDSFGPARQQLRDGDRPGGNTVGLAYTSIAIPCAV